jgi:hypothetical protein
MSVFDKRRLDPGIFRLDYKNAALKPVVLKDGRIEEG